MSHKQKKNEAQQAGDTRSHLIVPQLSKSQEAAGGSSVDPTTVWSRALASARRVVKRIPRPARMFLAGAVVGLVCGITYRPAVETPCVPRPCVNTSLDLPTNGTTESGELPDSLNGTLPSATASFSPAGEQNNTEAPPQSTQPLTFEEYKKQQEERLSALPHCRPRPAPVWLQEELSVLDDLRDKTLLTTVVVVDRCLCNALCRGHKRCRTTRHANETIFIEYVHEGSDKEVAERQVRRDLACACH